jgi:hypothetical protein
MNTPITNDAYRRGEPAPEGLLAVEYTVYPDWSEEDDGVQPRTITLWVGLCEEGAPNVDAGRERLEEEGWQVSDWGAA